MLWCNCSKNAHAFARKFKRMCKINTQLYLNGEIDAKKHQENNRVLEMYLNDFIRKGARA